MATSRDGLGVGLLGLGGWSGVGVLGGSVVRFCVLGRALGGWVWRWVRCLVVGLGFGWGVGWLSGWGAFGVLSVWIGVWGVLESMFSGLGSNNDEGDTEE